MRRKLRFVFEKRHHTSTQLTGNGNANQHGMIRPGLPKARMEKPQWASPDHLLEVLVVAGCLFNRDRARAEKRLRGTLVRLTPCHKSNLSKILGHSFSEQTTPSGILHSQGNICLNPTESGFNQKIYNRREKMQVDTSEHKMKSLLICCELKDLLRYSSCFPA